LPGGGEETVSRETVKEKFVKGGKFKGNQLKMIGRGAPKCRKRGRPRNRFAPNTKLPPKGS